MKKVVIVSLFAITLLSSNCVNVGASEIRKNAVYGNEVSVNQCELVF